MGDDLKLKARSNISKTGGGARDVRFGPWEEFETIVKVMFPKAITKSTPRKDPQTGKYARHATVVHVGTLVYQDQHGSAAQMAVEFWEPTGARSFEGRLARRTLPPFRPGTMPAGKGSVFMMLAQDLRHARRHVDHRARAEEPRRLVQARSEGAGRRPRPGVGYRQRARVH